MRRRAFTLIELLITIGIIVILAGMIIFATRAIMGGAKTHTTQIDLKNVQSMLTELEGTGPLSTTLVFPTTPTPPYRNLPGSEITVNSTWTAPSDVTSKGYGTGFTDRWHDPAIVYTQFVMGRIRSMPSARQMIQSLPAERLMQAQTDGPAYGANPITTANPIRTVGGTPNGTPDPPILVDVWNNPIIFAPGGGLNVAGAYLPSRVYKVGSVVAVGTTNVTYFKALKDGTLPSPAAGASWEQLPASYTSIITAPGNRPFFASAGADGDFQSPDDNQYSFEQ